MLEFSALEILRAGEDRLAVTNYGRSLMTDSVKEEFWPRIHADKKRI